MAAGDAGAGAADRGSSASWRIETARPRDLSVEARAAWRDLAGRALEPNPFMEPDYVLAAAQHLPEGRHAAVVLIRDGHGEDGVLRGVLPTLGPSLPWGRRTARVWDIPLAASGAPLLDRAMPAAALRAALAFLARSNPRAGRLFLPGLPAGGALAGLVARHAAFSGTLWTVRRGPARRETPGRHDPAAAVRGPRIRDAVETFLALDAARTERRETTPVVQDPAAATFVRAATRLYAARNACAVTFAERAGAPEATVWLGPPGAERPWLSSLGPLRLAPDRLDAALPLIAAAAQARAA